MPESAKPHEGPEDPTYTDRRNTPKGVQPKYLRVMLYSCVVGLLLIATFVSSRNKPLRNAGDKTSPHPMPFIQDNTATNAEALHRQLEADKLKEQHDLQLLSEDNNGGPSPKEVSSDVPPSENVNLGQGTVSGRVEPNPEREAALALAAKEGQRDDESRFASNIVFSMSSEVHPKQAQDIQPTAQKAQTSRAPSLREESSNTEDSSREAQKSDRQDVTNSTYKRPPEVNLNKATGPTYVVYEGLSLDTILMNRLDGDAAGPVKVLVSEAAYSHDHQHVLIPEGTVILGETRKIGQSGIGQQRRLAILFHRMLMPDGFSVDLDQYQGLDQIGEEGAKDKVDNHYLQIFGSSIALGVIAGAGEVYQGGGGLTSSGGQVFATGTSTNIANSSTTILSQFLAIPPTITIREGHRIKVYFTQDLLLPSYENHRIPQSF